MHVHIIGNGSRHTGCTLEPRGLKRTFAGLMLRQIGLPPQALDQDLDGLYVHRLVELVTASSLHAVVILAQERACDESGRPVRQPGNYYVPNSYVLELAERFACLLPAVSIHPARPDALDELDRCLDGGAVLLKLLPNCQNVDCSNVRYRRFWERMAQAGLPLLAHTGDERTLPVVNQEYADPRRLRLPLDCGVTVIAAHCATKTGFTGPDHFGAFERLIEQYDHLYGDTSAFTWPIRGRRIPQCQRPPLVDRMLHGSDFPIPVFGHRCWLRGQLDWYTFRKWQNHPNPLERDYQYKRAMGFPPEVFTRIHRLLRKPAASSRMNG